MNGEPAPDKKPTRIDYFFELGDIDPANITFSKGPDSGSTEIPSLITVRTRNDEKKIMSRYSWQPGASTKPDDRLVVFAVEAYGSDNDYVVRFSKAFKHAVEVCGGKASFFADSGGQDSDQQAPPVTGAVAAQSPPRRKDIPTIAEAANGAIVSIIMGNKDGPIAQGTGFFISKNGAILTNYHVIRNGDRAIAEFPDGRTVAIDGVLAFNKTRDVAIIKAHGDNFRTLTLGDSDQLGVGDEVVAIGSPEGLESTVSNGIVSAVRTLEEKGKVLQVTAPISHGSSGGPLFNMAGEVVGITSSGIEEGENLNFAIPINDAKRLLEVDYSALQNFPNEPEPTAAQTHEGGAPPSLSSPAAPAAQTPSVARDFFEQLYDAGAFSDDPVEYVCFSDDQDSDAFFTFGAVAYDERYARAATPPSAAYIYFLSDGDMKDLSRGKQKFFRKGGRTLLQYVYEKGVKVDMRWYDWTGSSWRSSIQTAPYTFAIRQLSIEPETMRYVQRMKTEITDTGTLDDHAEDGVCEKITNPK